MRTGARPAAAPPPHGHRTPESEKRAAPDRLGTLLDDD